VKRRTVLLAALFAVSALVSCSGDDPTGEPTTAAVLETTPVTAASSTSAPHLTAAVPTVDDPTTTIEPTTTIDAVAQTKAAVAAAIVRGRQNYQYALQNYDAPDALDVLARTTAANSPSWELTLQNMDTLRTNGWRSRPNPAVPSVAVVEGDVELQDGPPATRAEVTVCSIDSDTLFEPAGAPDGSDTIVNDEVIARRTRVTLVLEDGAWKAYEGTVLASWTGETTCPAS
jgi:hypothetical protein